MLKKMKNSKNSIFDEFLNHENCFDHNMLNIYPIATKLLQCVGLKNHIWR